MTERWTCVKGQRWQDRLVIGFIGRWPQRQDDNLCVHTAQDGIRTNLCRSHSSTQEKTITVCIWLKLNANEDSFWRRGFSPYQILDIYLCKIFLSYSFGICCPCYITWSRIISTPIIATPKGIGVLATCYGDGHASDSPRTVVSTVKRIPPT